MAVDLGGQGLRGLQAAGWGYASGYHFRMMGWGSYFSELMDYKCQEVQESILIVEVLIGPNYGPNYGPNCGPDYGPNCRVVWINANAYIVIQSCPYLEIWLYFREQMLKRSLTEYPAHPPKLPHPKKHNPYTLRLQATKLAQSTGSNSSSLKSRTTNYRKATSLSLQLTISDNQGTSGSYDDDISPTIMMEGVGRSRTEQYSPVLKKRNKMGEQVLCTSCNIGQSRQEVKELPSATIAQLTEFIDYYLENQTLLAQQIRRNREEMQAAPLSIIEGKLTKCRAEVEKIRQFWLQCQKKRIYVQEQSRKQQHEIEEQVNRLNIEIVALVHQYVDKKDLMKTVKQLEKKIEEAQIQQNSKYCEIQKVIEQNLTNLNARNDNILKQISRRQEQINIIEDLKQRIQGLESQLAQNARKKTKIQMQYHQLVKQKSSQDIKQQLSNKTIAEDGSMSNWQIMQSFYKRLAYKTEIIKSAVATHSENHQFLSSLQMQEQQREGKVKITKKSNKFSESEQKIISQNSSQYLIYQQYFKTDQQIKKLEESFGKLEQKHLQTLNKIKDEVQKAKKCALDQAKKIKDLGNMETIRQAQIAQLRQILKEKQQQLKKFQNSQNSFQAFRSSFIGF